MRRQRIEHGVGIVVFRQERRVFGKHRVGLNGEVVDRQVRRRERQRSVHVFGKLRQGLPGQRVHQIEVKGVKHLRGFAHRGQGLRAVVHATQCLQMRVVEALYAYR